MENAHSLAGMNDHSPVRRRPTNVSLNPELVEEARALGVNVSRACDTGLEAELKSERARQWKAENAEAIASFNAWFRENGVLLGPFSRDQ